MAEPQSSRRGWLRVIAGVLLPCVGITRGAASVAPRDKHCPDPLRRVTTFVYDQTGRLLSVRAELMKTSILWDTLGPLPHRESP